MSKRCVFVAMSSQKGGVGKTTSAVNIAAWLGAKGTYLICPMLRRRYLAPLSLSRYKRQKYAKRKGVEHFAFLIICLKG